MNDRIQVQTADLKQFTLEGNVATSRIDDAAHKSSISKSSRLRLIARPVIEILIGYAVAIKQTADNGNQAGELREDESLFGLQPWLLLATGERACRAWRSTWATPVQSFPGDSQVTTTGRKLHGVIFACLLSSINVVDARADDAVIIKSLQEKGIAVTETKGALSIADCTKVTDADYRAIGNLTNVKSLSFGIGFTDKSLALLTSLSQLESFTFNGFQFSDESVQEIAEFKKLRTLTFFHPGKQFTGAGLGNLADLAGLERFSIGGSFAFNDDGMAAVGKLRRLKEIRVWHAGNTNEGVKHLKDLPALESLTLGQRLAQKGDACPNDETIALLAEFKLIKALELQEARLNYDVLVRLRKLASLKKLTLNNIDISEADIERVKKELPGVQVTWTKPNEAAVRRINALFGEK